MAEESCYKFDIFLTLGPLPGLKLSSDENEFYEWDFFTRTIFSHKYSNPMRKMESYTKDGLTFLVSIENF